MVLTSAKSDASSVSPHSHPGRWVYSSPHFANREAGAQRRGAAAPGHTAGIAHQAVGPGAGALLLLWSDRPQQGCRGGQVAVTGIGQGCSGALRISKSWAE